MKFSRTPARRTRPAPALGEHTEEVLREAGLAEEEIAALIGAGAAAGPRGRGRARFMACR